jgi:hypothetical protein
MTIIAIPAMGPPDSHSQDAPASLNNTSTSAVGV